MTGRHGLLRGACQRARVCATRWLAMTGGVTPSLRGAKRRSNPSFFSWRDGLLRCARNDGEAWIASRSPSACIRATRWLAMTENTRRLRQGPRPRCGEPLQLHEPMQLQSWVGIFDRNHTEQRAIAGPRAFNGLCDDEGVPLICPTCQVLAQSVLAGDRLLLCMGLFSIFLVGSHSDAAWLRESRLKPHPPARPSL